MVRKSRGNGLFWHEIDDGRVNGGRVSGRHLLLSVIRFRECQYSVMLNPARQSSAAGLAGRQHISPPGRLLSVLHPLFARQSTSQPIGAAFFHLRKPDIVWWYRCRAAYNKTAYCIQTIRDLVKLAPFLSSVNSFADSSSYFFFSENIEEEINDYLSLIFKINILKDLSFLSFIRIKSLTNHSNSKFVEEILTI